MTSTNAQSVVELITTYSWALLIITLFVAIIFIFSGTSSQTSYLSSQCNIQPSFPCLDTLLTSTNTIKKIQFTVEFVNNLPTPLLFTGSTPFNVSMTNIGASGTSSNKGACTPNFALSGAIVICQVSINGFVQPPVGSNVNSFFTIKYEICQNSNQISCSANQIYFTSGQSTQSMAPAAVSFYNVKFQITDWTGSIYNGNNGIIFVNGVPYADSTNALFINTGNYIVFGQPPTGYAFSSFSAVSASSTLLPVNSPNSVATLLLTAPVTMNVIYTSAMCGACYPNSGPGGAPVCPALCPNSRAATCTAGAGTICKST